MCWNFIFIIVNASLVFQILKAPFCTWQDGAFRSRMKKETKWKEKFFDRRGLREVQRVENQIRRIILHRTIKNNFILDWGRLDSVPHAPTWSYPDRASPTPNHPFSTSTWSKNFLHQRLILSFHTPSTPSENHWENAKKKISLREIDHKDDSWCPWGVEVIREWITRKAAAHSQHILPIACHGQSGFNLVD